MHCGRCFYKDKQHLYHTISHKVPKQRHHSQMNYVKHWHILFNWSNTFSLRSVKSLWINDCAFLSFKQLRHHWNCSRVKDSSSLTLTCTVYAHIYSHTELLAAIKLLNDDHMSQYSSFSDILIKHINTIFNVLVFEYFYFHLKIQ